MAIKPRFRSCGISTHKPSNISWSLEGGWKLDGDTYKLTLLRVVVRDEDSDQEVRHTIPLSRNERSRPFSSGLSRDRRWKWRLEVSRTKGILRIATELGNPFETTIQFDAMADGPEIPRRGQSGRINRSESVRVTMTCPDGSIVELRDFDLRDSRQLNEW